MKEVTQTDGSTLHVIDEFIFADHFRTDEDWLNWQISTKNISELNSILDGLSHAFWKSSDRLLRIEKLLKENGLDREDPSRSDNPTNETEAVGAASTSSKKGRTDDVE